jgi:hypothetical protein
VNTTWRKHGFVISSAYVDWVVAERSGDLGKRADTLAELQAMLSPRLVWSERQL